VQNSTRAQYTERVDKPQSSFVLKAKKTDKRILYLSAAKLETSFTEFINYGIRGHLKPRAAT
jgi:hypothetical protein